MAICTFEARTLASEACNEDLMMQARNVKNDVIGLTETRRHRPLHAVFETGMRSLTRFVAYAPTSSYEEEEVEAFCIDLERIYREDNTFSKVIVGDFNAKIGPRRTAEELHIGTHGVEWNEKGERLSEFIMTTNTIHGNS
uniref:Endo/exonuclease/phosphatase domain-containing protein n=1 Tax=Haemonchus contortus TaxID=6289 RepID=A0A7I4Z5D5_HAECO